MRGLLSTVGPAAVGLATSVLLVVVCESALASWLQPMLTVDTGFDRAMQAIHRLILIDSYVVSPAAAIVAGGVVGLLSRRKARIAALIAALPVTVLGVVGAAVWLEALGQIVLYGGLAWVAATFTHRWRHPVARQRPSPGR